MLTIEQALESIPEWHGLSDEERKLLERLLGMVSADDFKGIEADDLVQLRKAMMRIDADIPNISKLKKAISGVPAAVGRVVFI